MMKSQHEKGPKNLQNGAPEAPPGTEGKNIFFGFWVVRWPLGRQEGPKSTQEAPKTPLRGPKTPQEAPRRAPRGRQDGPRGVQDPPKSPPVRSKIHPRPPISPPRPTKNPQNHCKIRILWKNHPKMDGNRGELEPQDEICGKILPKGCGRSPGGSSSAVSP